VTCCLFWSWAGGVIYCFGSVYIFWARYLWGRKDGPAGAKRRPEQRDMGKDNLGAWEER